MSSGPTIMMTFVGIGLVGVCLFHIRKLGVIGVNSFISTFHIFIVVFDLLFLFFDFPFL